MLHARHVICDVGAEGLALAHAPGVAPGGVEDKDVVGANAEDDEQGHEIEDAEVTDFPHA